MDILTAREKTVIDYLIKIKLNEYKMETVKYEMKSEVTESDIYKADRVRELTQELEQIKEKLKRANII